MDRLLKLGLIALVSLIPMLGSPAHASHGDPDVLTIVSAHKYVNVATTGDALFVVRYAMLYTITPTTPINETTIGRIMDVGGAGVLGTVNITSNAPIIDNGYSHGLFSFYFPTAPVPTGTLTVEISPNPADDDPLSSLSATKTSFSIGTRSSLVFDLRNIASTFETIWGADIIDFATGSGKLTLTGADYFNAAIPNLGSYAPDLFVLGMIDVDINELIDPVDFSYRDSLRTFWDNTPFGAALDVISTQMNIPRQMLEFVLVVIFNGLVGAFIFWRWHEPEPALLVTGLGVVVSGILGLGYLEFVFAIAALAVLVFAIKMFFMPSGA